MTLQIIRREQWGARYADGCGPAPLPASYLWLHHSTTTPPPVDASLDADAAAVRTLEDIGQQRFGCGISYTYAVAPSGRCFEGHTLPREGTHTLNHNLDSRAIVLIGDYSTRPPTEAQMATVAELVATGRVQGAWTSWLSGGHRDAEVPGYTECPGDAAEAAIPEINRLAQTGDYGGNDVSYDDAVRALRDMLRLPASGLAVPRGQVDNGNLAAILVGMAQAEVNRDNAEAGRDATEAARLDKLGADLAELQAMAAAMEPATLAAAIVAKMPPASPDEPDLQGAIEHALRAVLGGLDNPPVTP